MLAEGATESKRGNERVIPLALKFGLVTVAIMVVAAVFVARELAIRERASLVAGKRRASEQVAELFATYDAAALAFGDPEQAHQDALKLAANRDVVFVAVWASVTPDEPFALVGRAPRGLTAPEARARTIVGGDTLDVIRPIRDPEGGVLGVARVRVSLGPENRAFHAVRDRIVRAVASATLALVALLTVILTVLVTNPIGRVVNAARQLERGKRVGLASTSNDEVGVLARAFDRMAGVIADREASLHATTGRLQGVLDHMGQAILVFDREGVIEKERSREASTLVGDGSSSIVEVLFPDAIGAMVEREAFEVWMGAVFGRDLASFDSLADLAPTQTALSIHGRWRTYTLEFKPVLDGATIERMMLVATDVTEERALRADVARKDEEHQKRVAAMRRLVAGGGQVFVRFLEGARFRIGVSRDALAQVAQDDRHAVADVFRHVHTLRGEARCFDLDTIESRLARVEFGLSDLRTRFDERYDLDQAKDAIRVDLDRVDVELGEAEALFVQQSPVGAAILDQVTVRKTDIVALEALVSARGDAVRAVVDRLASRPFGETVFLIAESVERWANRESKAVLLVVEGRDTPVPPDLARVLPGVLAHLVRNAIAHGIEARDERVSKGKPERATITLGCETLSRGVAVIVGDDGAGFDVEGLRARAKAAGLADGLDLTTLVSSHLSTRDEADELAGHGVGLDAVRAELREVGYDVRIDSQRGQGSTIRVEPGVIG